MSQRNKTNNEKRKIINLPTTAVESIIKTITQYFSSNCLTYISKTDYKILLLKLNYEEIIKAIVKYETTKDNQEDELKDQDEDNIKDQYFQSIMKYLDYELLLSLITTLLENYQFHKSINTREDDEQMIINSDNNLNDDECIFVISKFFSNLMKLISNDKANKNDDIRKESDDFSTVNTNNTKNPNNASNNIHMKFLNKEFDLNDSNTSISNTITDKNDPLIIDDKLLNGLQTAYERSLLDITLLNNQSNNCNSDTQQRPIKKIFSELNLNTLIQLKKIFSIMDLSLKKSLYISEIAILKQKYKFIKLKTQDIYRYLITFTENIKDFCSEDGEILSIHQITDKELIINLEMFNTAQKSIEEKLADEDYFNRKEYYVDVEDKRQKALNSVSNNVASTSDFNDNKEENKKDFSNNSLAMETCLNVNKESYDYTYLLNEIFNNYKSFSSFTLCNLYEKIIEHYKSKYMILLNNMNPESKASSKVVINTNTGTNSNTTSNVQNQDEEDEYENTIRENILSIKSYLQAKEQDFEFYFKEIEKSSFYISTKLSTTVYSLKANEDNYRDLEKDFQNLFINYHNFKSEAEQASNEEALKLADENHFLMETLRNQFQEEESLRLQLNEKQEELTQIKEVLESNEKVVNEIKKEKLEKENKIVELKRDYEYLISEIHNNDLLENQKDNEVLDKIKRELEDNTNNSNSDAKTELGKLKTKPLWQMNQKEILSYVNNLEKEFIKTKRIQDDVEKEKNSGIERINELVNKLKNEENNNVALRKTNFETISKLKEFDKLIKEMKNDKGSVSIGENFNIDIKVINEAINNKDNKNNKDNIDMNSSTDITYFPNNNDINRILETETNGFSVLSNSSKYHQYPKSITSSFSNKLKPSQIFTNKLSQRNTIRINSIKQESNIPNNNNESMICDNNAITLGELDTSVQYNGITGRKITFNANAGNDPNQSVMSLRKNSSNNKNMITDLNLSHVGMELSRISLAQLHNNNEPSINNHTTQKNNLSYYNSNYTVDYKDNNRDTNNNKYTLRISSLDIDDSVLGNTSIEQNNKFSSPPIKKTKKRIEEIDQNLIIPETNDDENNNSLDSENINKDLESNNDNIGDGNNNRDPDSSPFKKDRKKRQKRNTYTVVLTKKELNEIKQGKQVINCNGDSKKILGITNKDLYINDYDEFKDSNHPFTSRNNFYNNHNNNEYNDFYEDVGNNTSRISFNLENIINQYSMNPNINDVKDNINTYDKINNKNNECYKPSDLMKEIDSENKGFMSKSNDNDIDNNNTTEKKRSINKRYNKAKSMIPDINYSNIIFDINENQYDTKEFENNGIYDINSDDNSNIEVRCSNLMRITNYKEGNSTLHPVQEVKEDEEALYIETKNENYAINETLNIDEPFIERQSMIDYGLNNTLLFNTDKDKKENRLANNFMNSGNNMYYDTEDEVHKNFLKEFTRVNLSNKSKKANDNANNITKNYESNIISEVDSKTNSNSNSVRYSIHSYNNNTNTNNQSYLNKQPEVQNNNSKDVFENNSFEPLSKEDKDLVIQYKHKSSKSSLQKKIDLSLISQNSKFNINLNEIIQNRAKMQFKEKQMSGKKLFNKKNEANAPSTFETNDLDIYNQTKNKLNNVHNKYHSVSNNQLNNNSLNIFGSSHSSNNVASKVRFKLNSNNDNFTVTVPIPEETSLNSSNKNGNDKSNNDSQQNSFMHNINNYLPNIKNSRFINTMIDSNQLFSIYVINTNKERKEKLEYKYSTSINCSCKAISQNLDNNKNYSISKTETYYVGAKLNEMRISESFYKDESDLFSEVKTNTNINHEKNISELNLDIQNYNSSNKMTIEALTSEIDIDKENNETKNVNASNKEVLHHKKNTIANFKKSNTLQLNTEIINFANVNNTPSSSNNNYDNDENNNIFHTTTQTTPFFNRQLSTATTPLNNYSKNDDFIIESNNQFNQQKHNKHKSYYTPTNASSKFPLFQDLKRVMNNNSNEKKFIIYDFLSLRSNPKIQKLLDDNNEEVSSYELYSEDIFLLDEENSKSRRNLFITSNAIYILRPKDLSIKFRYSANLLDKVTISDKNTNLLALQFFEGDDLLIEIIKRNELLYYFRDIHRLKSLGKITFRVSENFKIRKNKKYVSIVVSSDKNNYLSSNFENAQKVGYLMVYSNSFIMGKSFKEKLVVLSSVGLLVFDDPNKKPSDFLRIQGAEINKLEEKKYGAKFVFELLSLNKENIIMCAKNEEEMEGWIKDLKQFQLDYENKLRRRE